MKIRVRIVDTEYEDKVLEDCGSVETDSVNRALQLFAEKEQEWADKGYATDIEWEFI